MVLNATQYASGLAARDIVLYGLTDASLQVPVGPTGSVADGSGVDLARLGGFSQYDITNPTRVEVTAYTACGTPVVIVGGYDSTPQATVTFQESDLTWAARIMGSQTFDKGDATFGVRATQPLHTAVCLVINTPGVERGTGKQMWDVRIIPRAKVTPQPGGSSIGSPNTNAYLMQLYQTDNLPWLEELTEATHGTTHGWDIFGSSPYPVSIATFAGNGAATTFDLDYPLAEDDDGKIWAYEVLANGTVSELTWVADTPTTDEFESTTTGGTTTITFGDTHASGTTVVVTYMFDPDSVC